MKDIEVKWPLFWCLSAESQAKLMQLYYDENGERLNIPREPSEIIDTEIEDIEEISKIMKVPTRFKRAPK